MKMPLCLRWLALVLPVTPAAWAARFAVTVEHELEIARPAEVVVLPFAAVRQRLPDVTFDHVQVRRADTGALVPFQITNFTPNDRPAKYDDLIWQHDFAAGEKSVTYFVETTDHPVAPFPARVFARHVPERLDDFAWENDRMAHRAYGARLNTSEAGKSQLRSAGLDYWAKKVRYLIVDRWYLKGHDAYHVDSGEGLDTYSVGTNAGVGGTAVWHDGKAHTAGNWQTFRVLANGPLRAVFELDYAPVEIGGVTVTETKRFTVDAGRNLDRIESRFTLSGADRATLAVGLTTRSELNPVLTASREADILSDWSQYPDNHGAIGTGIVLQPGATTGTGSDEFNAYLLTSVDGAAPLTYYAGGGWSLSGDFPHRESWEAYLRDFAQRLRHPITLTLDPAE